ncbi:X-box-binding protein 1-like [Daphnia carinata]|uniref:X-box-binding protein 1-like n=1 Tax=Daphnia carinata TaxID=120202 RepID=UPI002580EE59|nr:X-box-binding protein 1-like [Daphnia carinata]
MQIIVIQPGSQAALNLAEAHQLAYSSSSSTGEGSEVECETNGEDNSQKQPTRKRQRLDHMTEQEKFLRRKLKNRVAAQTARDKKKAKMDELEELVNNLTAENNHLRAENQRLLAENARLTGNHHSVLEDPVPKSMERIVYPVESAALINGPLPQGQGYTPSMVLKLLLHLMLVLQSPAVHLKSNKLKRFTKADIHSQYFTPFQQLKNCPLNDAQSPTQRSQKYPP